MLSLRLQKSALKNKGVMTVCLVCDKQVKLRGLTLHLKRSHSMTNIEYLTFQDVEIPHCHCGNFCKWEGPANGFSLCCSRKCGANTSTRIEALRFVLQDRKVEITAKRKKTVLKYYGVECVSQAPMVIAKSAATKAERYTPERAAESQKKMQETCFERYRFTSVSQVPVFREKVTNTNIERYGVPHALQFSEILRRKEKTTLERHGSEYPKIFRMFVVDGLDCQSSAERLFVELRNELFPDASDIVSDCPIIKYTDFDGAPRRYFPDFYSESFNTVIEIKSSWTLNEKNFNHEKGLNVLAKLSGAVAAGFNFKLFVIDGPNSIRIIDNISALESELA